MDVGGHEQGEQDEEGAAPMQDDEHYGGYGSDGLAWDPTYDDDGQDDYNHHHNQTERPASGVPTDSLQKLRSSQESDSKASSSCTPKYNEDEAVDGTAGYWSCPR